MKPAGTSRVQSGCLVHLVEPTTTSAPPASGDAADASPAPAPPSSEGAASWRAGSGASPAERLVASICVDVLGLTSASSLPDEARSRLANLLGEAAELVRDPPSAEADPLCTRPPGLSCG